MTTSSRAGLQRPTASDSITRHGVGVSRGQDKFPCRPRHGYPPRGRCRCRCPARDRDMRSIRARIGRKTTGREPPLQIGHQCRQGVRRRCRAAPKHTCPREMTDAVDLELERITSNLGRGQLRPRQHLRRQRPEKGERQMQIIRVGRARAGRYQVREPIRQRGAGVGIGPQGEKPTLRQGRAAPR
jgi:hypothetical protein